MSDKRDNDFFSAIGSFLRRGCFTLILGTVGVILLLWGIGTCMGIDGTEIQTPTSKDSISVKERDAAFDDKTESDSFAASGDYAESSERDFETEDVPFDESSTVILGE